MASKYCIFQIFQLQNLLQSEEQSFINHSPILKKNVACFISGFG